ncbi:MAG: glycosyltransferase family 39 protein [Chloroflexi bacterium]|nr:glycosyltransferase family 39 protein [Chloroflexota bacterium]
MTAAYERSRSGGAGVVVDRAGPRTPGARWHSGPALGGMRLDRAGLVLVALVALATRFVGLDYGLPHSFYPDENKVYEATIAIVSTGDLRPIHFFYPPFWTYVLSAALKGGMLLAGPFGGQTPYGPATLENLGFVLWAMRAVTAVTGVVTAIVVYLLARRLFTALNLPYVTACALAAASFLALSPLHVQHSHVASPDVPTTMFVAIAAYFALRIVEDGRTRWYVLAGLATGLAAGVKHPSAAFALVIVLAHLTRCRVMRRHFIQSVAAALFDRRLWLAGLVTVVAFVGTSPYVIIDWDRFRAGLDYETDKQLARGQSGELFSTGLLASFLYAPAALRWGLDTPVALLAALGLSWGFWTVGRLSSRQNRHAPELRYLLVFLIYPVLLCLFSWLWQIRYARYLLTVVPFACVLAGLGVAWLAGRASAMRAERRDAAMSHVGQRTILSPGGSVVVAVAALGALFWQADGVVRYDYLLTRPDTRVVSARWISANLPPDQQITTEWYGPPHPNARSRGLDLSDDPLARYRKRGVVYIATSSYVYNRWLVNPDRFPKRAEFYGSLDDQARLLFAVAPEPLFEYDLTQDGWQGWHGIPLDDSARPGPIIRIYDIRD